MKMPDRIEAFSSVDEAAATLAAFAKVFAIPCAVMSAEEIVRESADSAWMRQLARKCAGGAEVYWRWAGEIIPRMVKSARYVINQEQYDMLVRRTGMGLLRSWRELSPARGARLSFGVAFRTIDLLFKAINESKDCRADIVQSFLHVPLDAATLRPLRLCINELVDRDFAIEIPATIPAGFVATEEQYVLLQEAIFTLAERASAPPIVYAYFCEGV
jgi:hypothetical protein